MAKLSDRLSAIESQLDRIEALLHAKQAGKRAYTKRKKLFGETVRLNADEEKQLNAKFGFRASEFILWFDGLKREKGYVYASDFMAMQRWGFKAWDERNARDMGRTVCEVPSVADENEAERKWRESNVDSGN